MYFKYIFCCLMYRTILIRSKNIRVLIKNNSAEIKIYPFLYSIDFYPFFYFSRNIYLLLYISCKIFLDSIFNPKFHFSIRVHRSIASEKMRKRYQLQLRMIYIECEHCAACRKFNSGVQLRVSGYKSSEI